MLFAQTNPPHEPWIEGTGGKSFTRHAVTALDLRGRGRSEGERFHVEHVDEYVSDLSRAIELAQSRDPELPCFLLGHSAGRATSDLGRERVMADIVGWIEARLPRPETAAMPVAGEADA